jgi:hypothetical protein
MLRYTLCLGLLFLGHYRVRYDCQMVLLCSPPSRTAGAAAAFAGVGVVAGVDLPQNILGATAHADQPIPFVRLMHCGIREGMQPTISDRAL